MVCAKCKGAVGIVWTMGRCLTAVVLACLSVRQAEGVTLTTPAGASGAPVEANMSLNSATSTAWGLLSQTYCLGQGYRQA